MRSRPTEPTAALAALISGNHRYLATRARAEGDGVVSRDVSANSPGLNGPDHGLTAHDYDFAVFVSLAIDRDEVARIFDLPPTPQAVLKLTDRGGFLEPRERGSLEHVFAASRLVIVVVLAQLLVPEMCGIAFADAERRTFETLGTMLETSDAMRKRMRGRELRAVAAVFDPTSGRVTWLGEHPEQARFLNRD